MSAVHVNSSGSTVGLVMSLDFLRKKYFVDLCLQISKLKILFQSDFRLLRYQMSNSEDQQLGQQLPYFLYFFLKSSCEYMAANYICIKKKTNVYGKMKRDIYWWYLVYG